MKLRNRFVKLSEESSEKRSERTAAADFHKQRIIQDERFEAAKASSNPPHGNYEYEQRVAEEANFNTRRMIAEAAFYLAEHRGFAPGQEDADWLQAEVDVEGLLRNAQRMPLSF